MKIAYESTIEDAINSHVELLKLTGQLSRQKWSGVSYFTFLFFVFLYSIVPASAVGRLSIALPFSIMFGVLSYFALKDLIKKNIRKELIKNLGTEIPIPSEYEINDEGIIFRRLGITTTFSWASVQEIRDEIDAIKIIIKPPSIALIPKRVFEKQSDIQKWLDFVNIKAGGVQQPNPADA